MKKFFRILLILIMFIVLVYVTNITSIPDSIILLQGENLNLKTILGINFSDSSGETIEAVASDTQKISNARR